MGVIKVGTITVTKPFKHTQYFECAAWFCEFEIQPGTYEVFGDLTGEGYFVGSFWAKAVSKVTDASFQSRLGAHYGKDNGKQEIGQVMEASFSLGTYGTAGDEIEGFNPDPKLVKYYYTSHREGFNYSPTYLQAACYHPMFSYRWAR